MTFATLPTYVSQIKTIDASKIQMSFANSYTLSRTYFVGNNSYPTFFCWMTHVVASNI